MNNQGLFQMESLRSKALRAHARSTARSQPVRRARAWDALYRLWTALGRLAK